MKTLHNILLLGALCSFFFISCSSSDEDKLTKKGPDFAISDLQGTWNATSAVFSPGDPGSQANPVDIIAEDGSLTMAIQSNGRFTMTFNVPDVDIEPVTGEMFFENNEFFAIRFDDEPGDYDYFGATLTSTTFEVISAEPVADWDFDEDGNEEPAYVSLNLVRT
ncbi:MAG: hypothetical protein ACI815_000682 [Psychroserpens sp.]|jgi:hypothetical protein